MSSLEGQTVLITGSSRGMGAAAARLAKEQGARVVLHGRTQSPALDSLASELGAERVIFDVADRAQTHEVLAQLVNNAKIDALINSAGWIHVKPFTELTEEDWLREFSVNLFGMGHVCQVILPHMAANGYGRVVNVASIRAMPSLASARGVAYSTSKAAVVAMTTSLAKEYAPNVTVNSVCPGFIQTDMSQSWNETVWEQARSALVGRVGEPEDVAAVLIFLASKQSGFINAQNIVVDGGYSVAGK